MVFVVVYAFACLGVEIIFKSEKLQSDPSTSHIVNEHFYSLASTLLTLLAFANADSIAGIYVPLIKVMPGLSFYFGLLWLVVTVSLMNLVTAVIVENAIANAKEDSEMNRNALRKQLKELIPSVKEAFRKLDVDGKGDLTFQELEDAHIDLPPNLRNVIQKDKLLDLFEFMDMDASGEISETEFVDGVCALALSSVPIETTQTLQLLRQVMAEVTTIKEQLDIQIQNTSRTGKGWLA